MKTFIFYKTIKYIKSRKPHSLQVAYRYKTLGIDKNAMNI